MPPTETPVLVPDRRYTGKFVAMVSFQDRTVIASGKDAEGVYARAAKKGVSSPVVFFVPPKGSLNIY